MINSKLITLLASFSPEEMKEFEKFADSPYHARGRNFTPLLKILKSFYPEFTDKKFNQKNIFEKVYSSEKYSGEASDQKLRILFSSMYKLCLGFLSQKKFEEDKVQQRVYLLDQLRSKKLFNEFIKQYDDPVEEDQSIKGSISDCLNQHNLLLEYKSFLLDTDDFAKFYQTSSKMRGLLMLVGLIYCFKYESDKTLMKGYNLKAEHTFIDSVIDNINFEKLLERLRQTDDEYYPHIHIYYTVWMMEKNKDKKEYFYKLQKLLIEHDDIFGSAEKYMLWHFVETYCSSKLQHVYTPEMSKELLDVYKTMLKMNYHKPIQNIAFKITLFRNIAIRAFDVGDYEWLEYFVQKYSSDLLPRHKEDMEHYCESMIHFGKKDFEAAMENIMKVKYEFFLYKIDIKIMMMKIYYELNFIEQVLATADTTIQFLKNTDLISAAYKERVKNFVKYLKLILKAKTNGKANAADEIEFILNEIKAGTKINSANWLREKAESLVR